MNKTTKIIFIISILLNIFFIGFTASGVYKHFHRREEFKMTRKFSDKHIEMRNQINEERAKLFEILKSPNFNKQEFDNQLSSVAKLQEGMYVQFMNDMVKDFDKMTEEERKETIEKMTNRFERKGHRHHHGPNRMHRKR